MTFGILFFSEEPCSKQGNIKIILPYLSLVLLNWSSLVVSVRVAKRKKMMRM